jgi:diguanylate cyclase
MLVGVPDDPGAVRVLKAILEIAGACGSDVVAEGVETADQVEFLIANGVARAQGFQLAHPMRGSELTALLHRRLAPSPPPRRIEIEDGAAA